MEQINPGRQQIDKLASLIDAAQVVVAFTGAGISTESGIPDFRSPGGIWTKYNPEDFTYQKFLSSEQSRRLAWERFRLSGILDASPNPAHYALANLERMGKLNCLITQNIDGLHQKAGNSEGIIIELHGTYHWVVCLSCGQRYRSTEILRRLEAGVEVPECDRCGGILKTAAVSFGQPMPETEMIQAQRWSTMADLFIVIGSSLVVYPAAQMPVIAVQSGAKLVVVNATPTPMDSYAELVIREKAGQVLPAVVEALRRQQRN